MSSFNDVAVRNCQRHCINKAYKDAQNKLLLEGQDMPRPYLAQHELDSVHVIIIVNVGHAVQMAHID